jgi:6-phosphogluconolactonase
MFVYVGSRTTKERAARGEGISVFLLKEDSGALELVDIARGLVNPSYLALSANGAFLYAVHGDQSEVSAFRVDQSTGRITLLNTQGTLGKNPVHLAIDPTGRFLVVSNHLGGSLAVLPIHTDGSLEAVTQLLVLEGEPGPHRIEQKQAKPHFNPFDPTGRFVMVPDKGLNRIFIFRFDGGRLVPAPMPQARTRETAGPRHMAFHPGGLFAYVVNELDSTVTAYRLNPESGGLEPFHLLSTLPASFTGDSRAAGIQMDSQGRFLYASNRGFDSIAVFAIDSASGAMTFLRARPTHGKTPRFITPSPDGRFMFALNEDSDSIVTLPIDARSGLLGAPVATINSGSPVCMVFSAAPSRLDPFTSSKEHA